MKFILEVFLVVFFTVCYAAGGQGPKWMRRFLGSIGFGLGIIGLALWTGKRGADLIFICLGAAWYCPSLCIFSYGVNDGNETKKIWKRGIYGASLGVAGMAIALGASGAVHIAAGFINLGFSISNSIYFGVKNPFSEDPKMAQLILQYPKLQNLPTILEDVCIITGAITIIPFLF